MKKITFLLPISMSLCLCACAANAPKTTAAENAKEPGLSVVNGYENQSDLNTLAPYMHFGKIELQKDEKYISEGEKSAKVTLQSDKFNGAFSNMVFIYQSLKNISRGIDVTDVNGVEKVCADVYNSADEQLRMGIRFVYWRRYYGQSCGNIKYVTLAPKSFTTIELEVNYGNVPFTKINENERVKVISGIDYLFFVPTEATGDRIYYLDNFRVSGRTK